MGKDGVASGTRDVVSGNSTSVVMSGVGVCDGSTCNSEEDGNKSNCEVIGVELVG